MSSEYVVKVTLEVIECANCSMPFGVSERFLKDRRRDHTTFYCPHGHHNFYPQESEEEKLRKQKDAAVLEAMEERQKRIDAEKAHKRLVKTGVCPCCRRNFVALRRHMKTKHPDYLG